MAANFIAKIFKSKILKHFLIVFLSGVVIIFLVSFYLRSYTHHGQKIFTPSFKGLTVEQAEKLATEKKVKIKIIDSVYEDYAEPGTIIDQTPQSNFLIKEGRTIFVTIKANGQKMVFMPDLRSASLKQARSEIESYSLEIGDIKYQPSQFNDMVIEQLVNGKVIEPGASLPAGTKIDLLVGKKDGSEAVVPKLIGLTSKNADFKAAEYSLNIGKLYFDNSVVSMKDTAEAVVWKQSINYNTVVQYGTYIDIWLTIEPDKYIQ